MLDRHHTQLQLHVCFLEKSVLLFKGCSTALQLLNILHKLLDALMQDEIFGAILSITDFDRTAIWHHGVA